MIALTENIIVLKDVNKLPFLKGRNGKKINLSTIWRWSLRGLKGVKLETVRIGGKVCTSVEAVERFIERLNQPGETIVRTAGQRDRAIQNAERVCESLGV